MDKFRYNSIYDETDPDISKRQQEADKEAYEMKTYPQNKINISLSEDDLTLLDGANIINKETDSAYTIGQCVNEYVHGEAMSSVRDFVSFAKDNGIELKNNIATEQSSPSEERVAVTLKLYDDEIELLREAALISSKDDTANIEKFVHNFIVNNCQDVIDNIKAGYGNENDYNKDDSGKDYTNTFTNMLDMCDLKLKATDNGYILADAYTGENILEDDGDVRTTEEVINIIDECNYIHTHILNKIDLDDYGYFPEKSPFTWTTEEWVECMDDIPEIKEDFMQEYEILSMMNDSNAAVDFSVVAEAFRTMPDKISPLAFLDDKEKMADFKKLSKEEFLESYSYLTEAEYDATAKALKDKDKHKNDVER